MSHFNESNGLVVFEIKSQFIGCRRCLPPAQWTECALAENGREAPASLLCVFFFGFFLRCVSLGPDAGPRAQAVSIFRGCFRGGVFPFMFISPSDTNFVIIYMKYLYRICVRLRGTSKREIPSCFIFLNLEDAVELGQSYYQQDGVQDVYIYKYKLNKENISVYSQCKIWRLEKDIV